MDQDFGATSFYSYEEDYEDAENVENLTRDDRLLHVALLVLAPWIIQEGIPRTSP